MKNSKAKFDEIHRLYSGFNNKIRIYISEDFYLFLNAQRPHDDYFLSPLNYSVFPCPNKIRRTISNIDYILSYEKFVKINEK